MSSAEASVVANRSGAFEPVEVQANFARQFDMAEPEKAMSSYMRIMHQHTQQQFETAAASDRRRRSTPTHEVASLNSETSRGSVSSTAS